MKAKVLIPFKDKETKKEHKKGDIIDVNVKRFYEIAAKGNFIRLVEDERPAKA